MMRQGLYLARARRPQKLAIRLPASHGELPAVGKLAAAALSEALPLGLVSQQLNAARHCEQGPEGSSHGWRKHHFQGLG